MKNFQIKRWWMGYTAECLSGQGIKKEPGTAVCSSGNIVSTTIYLLLIIIFRVQSSSDIKIKKNHVGVTKCCWWTMNSCSIESLTKNVYFHRGFLRCQVWGDQNILYPLSSIRIFKDTDTWSIDHTTAITERTNQSSGHLLKEHWCNLPHENEE